MGALESQELDEIADDMAEAFGMSRGSSGSGSGNVNGSGSGNGKEKGKSSKKTKNPDKGGLELLAEWIETEQAKNIVVLTGAGISTGAGIPDFRTPGTGLYDNLQKYDLPYPEAIFEINYYRRHPEAFVSLAKELWPGITFSPTITHSFLRLLCDKGLVQRLYTQNIDGLEFLAGIPDDQLVECHGHFRTASCIDCNTRADAEVTKETIVVNGETPICSNCGGHIKPDIVFFGEPLPRRFTQLLEMDVTKADLLLVMGTSLQVAPVSMMPDMVTCNRVLFNMDKVMKIGDDDIFIPGDCDTNVRALADLLGWGEELAEANESCRLQEDGYRGNGSRQYSKDEYDNESNEESKDSGQENDSDDKEKSTPRTMKQTRRPKSKVGHNKKKS